MKVLVLNTGSSSVKFSLYDPSEDALLVKGAYDRLGQGTKASLTRFYAAEDGSVEEVTESWPTKVRTVKEAVADAVRLLHEQGFLQSLQDVAAVAHRVVHGGEKYKRAALVDEEVIGDIRRLARFAPLHNPGNLQGILLCRKLLPKAANVAVFDTAFHQTMPRAAYLYGLSLELYKKHGIRKYGFHGSNHKYCAGRAAEIMGRMPRRLVTCHLGNGSSVSAIKDGVSVDNSMGFTPTDGLIMGTRSGALDPEVILYLLRALKESPKRIDEFLNKESGLKSIAGSSDMREIWAAAQAHEPHAQLAIDMLAYRVTRFIGSYAAVLGGLDCLVFTGGMGEEAWYLRKKICEPLGHLAVRLDHARNQAGEERISTNHSTPVLVVKANEELQIGREAAALIQKR